MKKPDVSIVIPIYNAESYIKRCLESVINQTLENIEIICVNDGSDDNSEKLVQEYVKKDKRIVLITTSHIGYYNAYNLGVDYAEAEYIGVVDADDWVEKSAFEDLYKAIKENNTDIVVCDSKVHVEKGEDPLLDEVVDSLKFYWHGKNTIIPDIHYCSNGYLWNKLFKKSIMDKYAIRMENLPVHSDDLVYKSYCAIAKNIYYLEKTLCNYVRRPFSLSSFNKVKNTHFPKLFVFDYLFDFYKRNNIFEEQKANFWKYLFVELTYVVAKKNRGNPQIQKEILNQLSDILKKVTSTDIIFGETYKDFYSLVKENMIDEALKNILTS